MNRRTFVAGSMAVAVSACGRSTDVGSRPIATSAINSIGPTAPPTTSQSTTPTTSPTPPLSTTPTSSVSAPTSTSPSSTVPTVAAEPWRNADFGALDNFIDTTGGHAFMIVEGGSVVHEWYKEGPRFARDIASAQKSILSLLVGIAIDKGLLAIDTPIDTILGTGWATGDTSTITTFHLLTMTSGLDNSLRVIDRPGQAWRYNNAFSPLFDVIEKVSKQSLNEAATEWLFGPIGATGAEFRKRANPGATTAIGLVCTAANLAAVGSMVLGHTARPVSDAWLAKVFAPSQSFNPAYGLLWWLNGQSSYLIPEGPAFDGPLIPAAPVDLVAALGKDDQKLYISAALDLIVVRLGSKADPAANFALSEFDNNLWLGLMKQRDA
jgi:CubicO group peptidase (beta-lactamase class C family)